MLENAKFIQNTHIKVEDKDTWNNMGFNSKTKELPEKEGIPNFKKTFVINKKIKCASICATALGVFDVFINNKRVGNTNDTRAPFDELKPGWTAYNKRVFAFTYDITNMLNSGENIVVTEVSCGWYSCRISFGTYGYKAPSFCCEIKIEYADGTTQTIVTDESWQTALTGPVKNADIWDGEYFDARVQRGESQAWENATIYEGFSGLITPAPLPRIVVKPELEETPIHAVIYKGVKSSGTTFGEINIVSEKVGEGCESCNLLKGESLVLDMGQNIVGRPAIAIKAKSGAKLTFFFAELLNDSGSAERGNDGPKGSVYVKNYRSALSRFVYVASGVGIEKYSPHHSFFGFRYLEICATEDVEILSVKGEVVGSDNKETCSFECSNSEVNKLWSNIVWGQRGNYLSIPTDCPQRDERLGWTGDTHIFCGAGSYIANINDFMRKWLQDARDTQFDDGSYGDVIPMVFKNKNFIGNAAWTDAGIIVPYKMYLKYGDISILTEHYSSMEKYMQYVSTFGLNGANTAYGDWLCYEKTDKRFIAVCYYAYTASIMEKCSRILGKAERARHYSMLYNNIKEHFIKTYVDENGITEKTQTGYLLALKFGLVPENMQEAEIKKLEKKIIENDYTLSTGFVGTGILCTTLSELGLHDLCYSLLLQTKDPSWLYSVRQGATTVWERWNSYTEKNGFGDVNMNSFNHYSYGAVAEWIIEYMAGIKTDENAPGFSHITIAPKPDTRSCIPQGQQRITFAKAKYDSAAGTIKSEWKSENSILTYKIEVPATATALLPQTGKTVTLNGKNITPEIKNGLYVFEVCAGNHEICVK